MEFWTQSPEETEALGGSFWLPASGPARWWPSAGPWAQGKPPSPGDWPGTGRHRTGDQPHLHHCQRIHRRTHAPVPLFDMYRLSSEEDLFDIGWEDYLDRGGICAVEWSEQVSGALGSPVTVTIEKIPGSDQQRKNHHRGGTPWES